MFSDMCDKTTLAMNMGLISILLGCCLLFVAMSDTSLCKFVMCSAYMYFIMSACVVIMDFVILV